MKFIFVKYETYSKYNSEEGILMPWNLKNKFPEIFLKTIAAVSFFELDSL